MATLGKASDCTLYIAPGVYNAAAGETFPIEPGIVKLQGQGSAPTDVIIEAPSASAAVLRYDSAVTRVSLGNLTVKGGNAGLHLDRCPAGVSYGIQGCVFTGAATDGVKTDYAQAPVFTDCVFTNNAQNGILFFETPNLSILR